jgi:hypothetical protein
MRKLLSITYIAFCLELGIFLFVLPWGAYWQKNYFSGHYPLISAITGNYFVRGAVSGLGLADIGMAIYEVWRLFHHPVNAGSRSPQ